MKKLLTITIILAFISFCSTAQTSSAREKVSKNLQSTINTMSKKEKAIAFINALSNQDEAAIKQLTSEDLIQHNPSVPNGRDVIINVVFPLLKDAGTHGEVIRVIEDGDFVVMHNHWTNASPFGGDDLVAFDIYRFDKDGKIAEHWDALQPWVEETVSGRSQIDGTVVIDDLDKTDANKVLAKSMVEDILMGKNPNKITDYISSQQYNQHNPGIKDGLAGIIEAVEYLTSQNNMFKYTKIHKVLGEGNFVLTISEGEWSGKTQVFYDLLRFENGKAVEHWDVIQAIPTEGLANNNGMFGF
ncbi:MAG: nuclear transport factor 2 family protein [Fulvivirga sp.]|uniref:nuclear transport factor 2 family protein n=1 Tax=Fulvivirga sp. TaxID=1931237 RepID=UPI0032ED40C7